MRSLILFLLIVFVEQTECDLSICDSNLCDGATPVFLSGMNQAWYRFGYDFGNGQYDSLTGAVLESYLENITVAGANSVRMWIHTDGRGTPNFNASGYAISPDREGTFISDLSKYLDKACEENLYVFLVLWTGAGSINAELKDMIYDERKLQAYIDNVLVPTVDALKDKPALAGWEIMNEPEGLMIVEEHENPCFDTSMLTGTGAGWTGEQIPWEYVLKFLNWQVDAIKATGSDELVTVGSWGGERASTDEFGYTNYYKDECLMAPSDSRPRGVIDIYQMHNYAWEGEYRPESPMHNHNSIYNIDEKPNIIGEFSQTGGDGRDITELFGHLFNSGYDGAWSWHAVATGENADDFETQARGVESLAGQSNDEGKTTTVAVC